jgi:tRNA(Ile)-lysidine synthase
MRKNKRFSLEDVISSFWRSHRLNPQDLVLLGLSGGADSMCLATLFLEYNIPFIAAHVNFTLRGLASESDARFVKNWCKKNKIRLEYTKFPTLKMARETKSGIEETARRLRYEWFSELAEKYGIQYVATAHHADDQAETVLLHLLRGSGWEGAQGIVPVRLHFKIQDAAYPIHLIRPLLGISKNEINHYINQKRIKYRQDATNLKTNLARNHIRHKVIPQLIKVNQQAASHLAEFAHKMQALEGLIRNYVSILLAKHLIITGTRHRFHQPMDIPAAAWHSILTSYGFPHALIDEIILNLQESTTSHFYSSTDFELAVSYNLIELNPIQPINVVSHWLLDPLPYKLYSHDHQFLFEWKTKPDQTRNRIQLFLAKRHHHMILRGWQAGDRMKPLGMKGQSKKIQDILTDKKIKGFQKKSALVLEIDGEIAWLFPGQTISESFKIKKTSGPVLEIAVTPVSSIITSQSQIDII